MNSKYNSSKEFSEDFMSNYSHLDIKEKNLIIPILSYAIDTILEDNIKIKLPKKIELFRGKYTKKLINNIFKQIKKTLKNYIIFENKCPYCKSENQKWDTHHDGCYIKQTKYKKIYYYDIHSASYYYKCNNCNKEFSTFAWMTFGEAREINKQETCLYVESNDAK